MQFQTFVLPAHWAFYLIYGDASYLSDEETAEIDLYIEGQLDTHPMFHIAGVAEETYFSRYHDADEDEYILTEVAEYEVQLA